MHIYNEFKSLFIIVAFLGYIFLFSGLIINFLQLCSCVIWSFNKELYRKINHYLALDISSQFTFATQWWSKSNCVLYINPDDLEKIQKEHAIVIMNHKYDIDWIAGWIICQRIGIMQGSKIIGKQSLKLLPIMDLRKILDNYPKNCFFNFLLFCEGLPELKHHILSRTKGFTLLLQGAEDRITGIYDLTVGFKKSGAKPTLLSIIKGRSCQAEIFVRRIPLSKIPKDTNEFRVEIQSNYYDLLIELSWMIIIEISSIFYLIKFLWTSSFFAQSIFLIVVILELTFLYLWWTDSNVTVYVDPQDLKYLQHEYSIILVNHRYEIDWLLGLVVAQELDLLGAKFEKNLKIVGKCSLSLIPILGWSWFFFKSFFLRRIWESDKKILEHDIQQLLNDYPDNYYFSVGCWFFCL
ncbi:unnamed protein product [Rotaria sp. Silwood2]|nr:unnamed protein product [Rotaria sp. Silwood2]